jgi:hypothetical protein
VDYRHFLGSLLLHPLFHPLAKPFIHALQVT